MNTSPATEFSAPNPAPRFAPVDRESFFDAQARNRRATWRMSGLCALAAALMGIPLALVITPLLYGVVLIIADIVNLFTALPVAFWQQANEIAQVGLLALQWLLQQKPADPQLLVMGAAVMLLPGILFSLLLWLAVELMLRHSGTGGALLALKAREPNQAELKELQLADVVQEMAIAAGLPAPKVMILDSPAANAAAIGASADDARILVSRGLLEDLDRDELEAVLAHLIASIGNGDLRIAGRMTSILQTCGLLVTIINSPFGRQSRGTLCHTFRHLLSTRAEHAQDAAAVADLLTQSADLDTDDIDRFFDTTGKMSRLRSIRNFLFFPIFLTNAAVKLLLWFFSLAVLGPSLALLWRTRQYLADASAVQLTRNPDSLASALQKLNEEPGEIAGANWASHLFLVSPRRGNGSDSVAFSAQQQQALARAWAASQANNGGSTAPGAAVDFAELSKQFSSTMRAAVTGDERSIARIRSAYNAIVAADPAIAAQFPNPDDLIAARQGDFAAMARLRETQRKPAAQNRTQQQTNSNDGSIGSMLEFHPPLKRRLKRLARMGANVDLGKDSRAPVVVLVLSLILGPFALLAVALLLLLIAILILASLTFTVIWLAVIHKIFALFGSPS